MTKFMNPSFSVNVGGQAYADGWERTFGGGQSRSDTPKSDIRRHVEEFHNAFGLPVLDTPTVPSEDRVKLRLRLIAEEFCELFEACGYYVEDVRELLGEELEEEPPSVNLVEVADALADLDYVVEGTRLEFGINGKPVADEVHRSNMRKLGPDGKPMHRPDGKVIKPDGWTPPDIAAVLEAQGWQKNS